MLLIVWERKLLFIIIRGEVVIYMKMILLYQKIITGFYIFKIA